ncbi:MULTISPECIES: lytic transglycosylase domain-containing protein [Streptomyces]|uniref:Lytic transglycosylase domain-containing protein n=1 Tax=Streptomyces lonegramiae TaxID=3075524 RepID=A0ABU2X975_9ACTN|nr:lytic transglycosylase domain-containing protein [Streptomyces sp. DSM 41529]MDT0542453.1 lytic transglycosylase domain-containing protein [Streptomyces sp. DSM 41529]
MVTRRSRTTGTLVGSALLIAAALLVVRQFTGPSEPELPTIPKAERPVVEAAARTCPKVSVPLLAAQIHAESDWRPDADSGHAQGISQFAPETWKEWGRDGDGDGKADVWEPKDAIPSQARYMCHLYGVVKDLPGDPTKLALAAYNAGPNAVLRARGIPRIAETREYVDRILNTLLPQYRESEAKYAAAHPSPSPRPSRSSGSGSGTGSGPGPEAAAPGP